MTTDSKFTFLRFLTAKKSVDDRSLNQVVWDKLAGSLPRTSPNKPLQILEIGAGIGTMVMRVIERNLVNSAEYTAIDLEEQHINHARRTLPIWAREEGLIFEESITGGRIIGKNVCLNYHLQAVELSEFVAEHAGIRKWDLIISHAFLDLVNIPSVLPSIFNLVVEGSLVYFTLNYDGLTILEPVIEPEFDQQVLTAYNQTMDQRQVLGEPSGDSQSGRHLFGYLSSMGAEVIAAGSSDWVVHAHSDGYLQDEAYFLHYLIHTIDNALKDQPGINQERFEAWIAERHSQVERLELVCIAHQIDMVARYPGRG